MEQGPRYFELDRVIAENLDYYCQRGYFPVNLGDSVGKRFKIVQKLSYDGHATVWLAREEDKNCRRRPL